MPTAIWKKISAGQMDPVYLLTGEEQYLIDETIDKFIQSKPTLSESSIIRFDLEETPVEVVLEEADTFPFLDDYKIIIANHANFLRAQDKTKEPVEHNLELLEAWLQNPSPTATVLFIAPYEKLDARKKITKTMKSKTTLIEANRIKGRDVTTWIQHEVSTYGLSINSSVGEYLVQQVGDNLLTLASEIQKMAAYLNFSGDITHQIVDELVPRTPEMNIFTLTESYIEGNVPKTIAIYHDLLHNGEEPIMLTSLVSGQIRLMLHVQSLRKQGYQQHQIAKELKVHPYRVKLLMERKSYPSEDRLMQIIQRLAEIDYKLKSTSGKRELLLEVFFMEPFYQ
jgi:DNA polymerase-3 subunit delta